MRYPAGHKEETRARIIRAAARVFRRHGYHAAGVDKVMEEAGLTAGGFYAHFPSKEALLAETLAPAASEIGAERDKDVESVEGCTGAEVFVERYLSTSHLHKIEEGCPLPALASEVARTGEGVKESFEAIIRDLATRLRGQSGDELSEDRALAIVALCVGGLGVARAVQDEDLAERILASCRDLARAGMAATADGQPPTATPGQRKRQ